MTILAPKSTNMLDAIYRNTNVCWTRVAHWNTRAGLRLTCLYRSQDWCPWKIWVKPSGHTLFWSQSWQLKLFSLSS